MPKKPAKKYTKGRLQEISITKLIKYCQKYKVPYNGIRKVQLIENILALQEGKSFPYESYVPTWDDMTNGEHRITTRIRRFAFEYGSGIHNFTQKEWAKRYEVSPITITKWLKWEEVQELIILYAENHERRIKQKFEQEEEEVIDEMIKLIKKTRFGDVKRKAIVDFLGFSGRKNVNVAKIEVRQGMKQGQQQGVAMKIGIADTDDLSKEQIEEEIKELESFE